MKGGETMYITWEELYFIVSIVYLIIAIVISIKK